MTGMPYLRQNSKSRWSWAGTAMIAPVPYSISTKLPTQIGTRFAVVRVDRRNGR